MTSGQDYSENERRVCGDSPFHDSSGSERAARSAFRLWQETRPGNTMRQLLEEYGDGR